jgi:hypothetical protein
MIRTPKKLAMVIAGLAALSVIGCTSAADVNPNSPSSSPPSSSSSRREVAAPIDGLDVRVLESNPPQYVLNVRAGLPSGCAEKNRHELQRSNEAITVSVLNWMPADNPPCTLIYGSYELNINLGSDFRRGATYSVSVNDKRTTFVAQ